MKALTIFSAILLLAAFFVGCAKTPEPAETTKEEATQTPEQTPVTSESEGTGTETLTLAVTGMT